MKIKKYFERKFRQCFILLGNIKSKWKIVIIHLYEVIYFLEKARIWRFLPTYLTYLF